VTLVGDAAHAHGGAFAAGGSLALDDSLALGLAFKEVFSSSKATFSPENINKALGLYSQTRQPHTARLLGIVHSQIDKKGTIFATSGEEDSALIARMTGRPNTEWLSEHDVEAAFTAAVELEGAQRQVRLAGPETKRDGEMQLQGSKL
jgi:salicylate hydroxylase